MEIGFILFKRYLPSFDVSPGKSLNPKPLYQPSVFLLGDGDDRPMTGSKLTLGGGVPHEGEMLQVSTLTKLVMAVGITVVHQYPFAAINKWEDTASLNRKLSQLLQMPPLHLPRTGDMG